MIEKKFGAPIITKDGVTVAKKIELKDPLANMGARMVGEVASKTSDVTGDGTTTATVLAQAIFRDGVRTVAAGASPMALKRGIDKAVEVAVEEIERLSREVTRRTFMSALPPRTGLLVGLLHTSCICYFHARRVATDSGTQ